MAFKSRPTLVVVIHFEITCEYQLHSVLNRIAMTAKDHGQNYVKFRPLLVRHLSRNCIFHQKFMIRK